MISFTDLTFIFRFLPIFLLSYYLVPGKYKNIVMLLGSIVFYAFGEPVFVFLLIGLTILNYFLAQISGRKSHKESKNKKYRILYIGVIALDIAVLVLFKCLSVFVQNSLWPVGLSFYIFKMISFQIDFKNGKFTKQPSFIETATYFIMFPQISQGPIMRFDRGDFDEEKKLSWEKAEEGLKYFILGFAMKTILADRIGILWNDLGMYGYESISTPLAWLGAFAYSFELYFDFWGYSLMSSGILVALGYDFIENFNHPYASKSISAFYRKWHVTLGEFFKDYVYFPLGGSRCDKKKMCLNLAIVWLLTGFWHGNGMNFIIWGIILGVLIILEKLFYGKKIEKVPVLGNIYVCVIIPLTWVVFAIGNLKELGIYFSRLFPFLGKVPGVVNPNDIWEYLRDYWMLFAAAIVLCIPKCSQIYKKYSKHFVSTILLVILFWISIYFSASRVGNPFMYLHF